MSNPKIIAFYLPQFHPTPHNNEWWGKGFTEWTNVARATPLFKGHEQPHIPSELGFYDLRLPESRKEQAELAKEYGIYGFCYWYYRFSKNNYELELPINEVLRTKEPDFPFMVCWCNESWHRKLWRFDGTFSSETLQEQKYGDSKDIEDFFYEVLPLFMDSRYIKIDDKPAFMFYKPKEVPNISNFMDIWNNLAKKEGLNGIFFIGYLTGEVKKDNSKSIKSKFKNFYNQKETLQDDERQVLSMGVNAITINRQDDVFIERNPFIHSIKYIYRKIRKIPRIIDYKKVINIMLDADYTPENVFPVVVPNWDHTPRSGYGGFVFQHSSPQLFKKYLIKILRIIREKQKENQIVFLKAWNEWGEGNYIEPDLKWGRGYLEAISQALNETKNKVEDKDSI